MIALTRIRDLELAPPGIPGRPLHLSAASGIVRVNARIYVVADDELHLGVFRLGDNSPGHVIRLFEGALPDSKIERKNGSPTSKRLRFSPRAKHFPTVRSSHSAPVPSPTAAWAPSSAWTQKAPCRVCPRLSICPLCLLRSVRNFMR
jgi:hypothetical protein